MLKLFPLQYKWCKLVSGMWYLCSPLHDFVSYFSIFDCAMSQRWHLTSLSHLTLLSITPDQMKINNRKKKNIVITVSSRFQWSVTWPPQPKRWPERTWPVLGLVVNPHFDLCWAKSMRIIRRSTTGVMRSLFHYLSEILRNNWIVHWK